jgi:membrane-associated phospholipid phosphatase
VVNVSRAAIFLTLAGFVPPAFGADLTLTFTDDTTPAGATAAPTEAETPVSAPPPPVDGRRATHLFLQNLGRNAIGMFSKQNLVPLGIGAGATLLATPFDDNVQRYFTANGRKAKWLGDFAEWLGKPIVLTPLAASLFLAGRLAPNHHRFRNATYDIGQAFLVNAAFTTAIKYPAHRLRPDGSNHLSFPSGHTSDAFAWATVANHYYGPKLGVPSFAFAALIGVGRMEKNVHWLSDVVGGATVGYLVGRTVTRRDSEPLSEPHAQLSISPSTGPGGKGVGLTASLQF